MNYFLLITEIVEYYEYEKDLILKMNVGNVNGQKRVRRLILLNNRSEIT